LVITSLWLIRIGSSRERDDITNVVQASNEHEQAIKAKAPASVWHRSEPTNRHSID